MKNFNFHGGIDADEMIYAPTNVLMAWAYIKFPRKTRFFNRRLMPRKTIKNVIVYV